MTLKAAVTLDGRHRDRAPATRAGSRASRRARWVHRLRDRVDAVLVGSGTARADDPRLTTRLPGGAAATRSAWSSTRDLSLPRELQLFRQRSAAPTLVAHASARTRRSAEGGARFAAGAARAGSTSGTSSRGSPRAA